MEKQENIIKKTCKELGLTYKQLAEKIGLSEGRVKQLAVSDVGEQVLRSCQMLVKISFLENQAEEHSELKRLLKKFIN